MLAAVLIGTIYVGREVFFPIALAILLSFVLAPLVRILERWVWPFRAMISLPLSAPQMRADLSIDAVTTRLPSPLISRRRWRHAEQR